MALEKSRKIRSASFPSLAFLARSSTSIVSCVSHDLFSQNPCWRSYMRLIHMLDYFGGHAVFKDLAKDAGEDIGR